MIDMSDTIAPKSDQLNADDLIVGPRTITITGGKRMDSADQPIAFSFEGDNGKPYKPCKSMRRVMVIVWGDDASQYVGRSMTIYRDPGVQFGGQQVGGIRISHMSHIEKPVTMALTATRANRKPFTVKPLAVQKSAPDAPAGAPNIDKSRSVSQSIIDRVKAASSLADLQAITGDDTVVRQRAWMREKRPELAKLIDAEVNAALAALDALDDLPGEQVTEEME